MVLSEMSDAEVEAVAAEPPSAQRERIFLEDRISKLKDGQRIFNSFMRGMVVKDEV